MKILLRHLFGIKTRPKKQLGDCDAILIKERFPNDYKVHTWYQPFIKILVDMITPKEQCKKAEIQTYIECIAKLRDYITTVDDAQTQAMLTATVNNLSINIAEMITVMKLCQYQFNNPEQAIMVEQMLLDFTERAGKK